MIQHYLKITFRNLVKYKLQSIISIMGLAVGIAFFIFSFYWLHYETSYDNFYPASNRTFLVCNQAETSHSIYLSPVMSTFIREYCPEVEDITCSFEDSGIDYSVNDKIIKSPAFLLVDKSFMNIFPQKILYGTLPRLENELIISETLARQFWKTPQEALGSILRQQGSRGIHLADPQQLRIVGIMADSPSNSSFHYTGYRIMKQFKYDINNEQEWRFANAIIHVMLRKNQKHKDFTQHLKSLLEKHKMTPEELKIKITPIYKKHFDFASEKSFSYSFISTFTIATFLLLCCVLFNFLNLFLNRYYQRTREVKLRKSVGANDIILMKQLMTEALFHGLMACLISGCLIEVLTPFFEEIFQISIQKNTLWLEYLAIAFISLSCIGIILTVPIIQFIQVSTKQSLVNKVRPHRHHIFRRISLSLQLVICLFFLTSTGVLYMQLRFIHNVDVGFDTQNIIEMRINPREQNGNDMLEEIKQLPMIKATTTASDYIVCKNITSFEERVEWNGQTEEDKKSRFARLALQNSGDKIFNFRLIEGRLFREEDWVTNSNTPRNIFNSPILNKIILTQSAVTAMRIEHPIGDVNLHMDYYNSFVIHPMLLDVLKVMQKHDKGESDFYKKELRRFSRYAEQQERMISPDGAYPVVGRSIAYRFGAFHVLSQAALDGLLPASVTKAQVRCGLTAVIKRHMSVKGNFDERGWLTLGFAGHQPQIAERYISTGSLYLCSVVFTALGLPVTDEFWCAPYAEWTGKKIWNGNKSVKLDKAIKDN